MTTHPVYEVLETSDDEDTIDTNEEEKSYDEDEDGFAHTTEEEEFASQTENEMTQDEEEISQDKEEKPSICIETRIHQAKSQCVERTLKKTETKIINWRRRLTEKRQTLQLKRNSRFEDINVLHRKLLSTWNDKMNCQHEYGTQCMRSIETSQAAWHAQANFNQTKHSFRPSSHGPTASNEEERYAREKENIQKQKVEQLARDLIATTKNRMKTLEKVIVLLSRELEEAKTDIQTLDKELLEIARHLEEMEDLTQTINEGEESNKGVETLISRRMLHVGDANLKNLRKSSEKERHSFNNEQEYAIKERSNIIYPSPVRNEELALRKSIAGPSSTNTGHGTCQSTSCRGSFPASAYSRREVHFSSSKTSGYETTDENPNEPTSSKSEYLYIYESNSRPSSVLPPASLPSGPRKRGRPRIHPEIVRMPKDNTVKRTRGRPRKYLKLELAKISSAD